jgi:hypothetical protein
MPAAAAGAATGGAEALSVRGGVGVGDVLVVGNALVDGEALVVGDALGVGVVLGVGDASGTHDARSGALVVFAAHGAHAAAPAAAAKKPSAHGAQSALDDAPTTLPNEPGGHSSQDAKAADHVPAGHGGPHAADAAGVSEPAAHALQDADCSADAVPAAHGVALLPSEHA